MTRLQAISAALWDGREQGLNVVELARLIESYIVKAEASVTPASTTEG